ncbi:hypothetical protein [Secundilactobacillus similis]|uniref:Uncharacterized protein n=1 Tax=Secundilactobacillus similis DSM 23365 = JCM 2765 TaxID=1423804 RepID=A0A0R2FC12_9LACO|nr:hypothetical protein [Secundilactobacillus similis]KRN26031.1 hypothetical protein FD14_GL000031 [Secundilactobacillus similis DSM 23365 = JCM 2765]
MADDQDKKHGIEHQVTEQSEGQSAEKSSINWHYVAFGIGSLIGLIMVVQDYGFSRSSLTYWRNFGIGIVALFAVILLVRWLWRKLVKWAGEQSEADEVEAETVADERPVKQKKKVAAVEPADSPKVLVDNPQPVMDKSAVNWRYRKF